MRLEGTAQAAARGALSRVYEDNTLAKRALEVNGTIGDGNTPDGSTRTGTAAEDEVLAPGGVGGTYTLPVATASVLGGIKDGTGLTIAGDGTASVDYGTTGTTAAAGNDSRIVGALQASVAASTYAPLTSLTQTAAASPTTGTHAQGEFVRNTGPTEQGSTGAKYITTGWTCVAGGSPGTWVSNNVFTGN